jgi:hypothetical protein
MTRDRNSFRVGTSKHETEYDVHDFIDGGPVPASFQEIWEHTENELSLSQLPGVAGVSEERDASGLNQVKPYEKYSGTEDEVYEYLDRFPGNGL